MKAQALVIAICSIALHFSVHALHIIPSWDSSITNDPNAAIIESTLTSACQYYEARFSNPATVTILFKEMTTGEGHSSWWYYTISYSSYFTALENHADTLNDLIALRHLPSGTTNPVTGTSNMRVKTANLHALGFTGHNSGLSEGYDGIIALRTSNMNLSRDSINHSKYDLLATAEHEIDEVLGIGSGVDSTNPYPEDLYRYGSTGTRNYTTNGDNAYFSIDGTNLLARFNQQSSGDKGDWWTAGSHKPQVQDAFLTAGATPALNVELVALDVIGYTLLPMPQPRLTTVTFSGPDVLISGTNGVATETYYVLSSTNPTVPLNQWTRIATNMLKTNGNFTVTAPDPLAPANSGRFFALQLQIP